MEQLEPREVTLWNVSSVLQVHLELSQNSCHLVDTLTSHKIISHKCRMNKKSSHQQSAKLENDLMVLLYSRDFFIFLIESNLCKRLKYIY